MWYALEISTVSSKSPLHQLNVLRGDNTTVSGAKKISVAVFILICIRIILILAKSHGFESRIVKSIRSTGDLWKIRKREEFDKWLYLDYFFGTITFFLSKVDNISRNGNLKYHKVKYLLKKSIQAIK